MAMSLTTRTKIVLALAVAPLVLVAACGDAGTNASGPGKGSDGVPSVVASFYPLEFVAERIGGPWVSVENLTPPGVEPHDVELTPKDVTKVADADLVIYLEGFSPAVDDAVSQSASDEAGFDVGRYADLDLTYTPLEEGEVTPDGAGAADPHFWLDPTRLADVATALGEDFARRDPANATAYRASAATLVAELDGLDTEFRTGLAQCRTRELVTGHAAFGYLAERYDLHQEGVAGVSPDVEPDAATLRDLSAHVRDAGVTTVYSESLVSPALAETVAREAGARVAVLDPLEGITGVSRGHDYLEVMRANLATLRAGQECS